MLMGSNKKNIDQLINESFQNTEFNFEDSSWNDIKNKLDNTTTVDKVVYSALNPESSKLPDVAWESMNDALDIETVWNRLAKRPKRRFIAFWWKLAGVALLFLITTYGLINFNDNKTPSISSNTIIKTNKIDNKKSETIISQNIKTNRIDNKKTITKVPQNVTSNKLSVKKNKINSGQNTNLINPKQNSKNIHELSKQDNQYVEFENTEAIIKIKSNNITLLALSPIEAELQFSNNSFDSLTFSPSSKLAIGLIVLTENTWVSDSYTRSGFSKNSLIFNDLVFTPTIGVFAKYNLKNNYALNTEFYINSVQKTRNNLFIDGDLTKREIKIEYIKTNISISKMIPIGYENKLHYLDLSTGIYLSYLKKSSLSYYGRNVSSVEIPDYANIDYGLTFNIGHQINLKKFIFGYGLHTNYGLNNIFNGNIETPKLFNQTRNFAYGIQLKFGYKF